MTGNSGRLAGPEVGMDRGMSMHIMSQPPWKDCWSWSRHGSAGSQGKLGPLWWDSWSWSVSRSGVLGCEASRPLGRMARARADMCSRFLGHMSLGLPWWSAGVGTGCAETTVTGQLQCAWAGGPGVCHARAALGRQVFPWISLRECAMPEMSALGRQV